MKQLFLGLLAFVYACEAAHSSCRTVTLTPAKAAVRLDGEPVWQLKNLGPTPVALTTESDPDLTVRLSPERGNLREAPFNGKGWQIFAGDSRYIYELSLVGTGTATVKVCGSGQLTPGGASESAARPAPKRINCSFEDGGLIVRLIQDTSHAGAKTVFIAYTHSPRNIFEPWKMPMAFSEQGDVINLQVYHSKTKITDKIIILRSTGEAQMISLNGGKTESSGRCDMRDDFDD